jgi:hypothetical protein
MLQFFISWKLLLLISQEVGSMEWKILLRADHSGQAVWGVKILRPIKH